MVVEMARSGPKGWGQKAWIEDYWLRRMKEPFPEPYSIRQAFYSELPEIVRLVPDTVKERRPNWPKAFYNYMCVYLSDLVLAGAASYRAINVFDDSGANTIIWQKFRFHEKRPPIGMGFVEYPIEVWVENNATYGSVLRLFDWDNEKQSAPFQLNLISQRGFANTQRIEEMKLDRPEDVKVILNLTDFDPSGYCMGSDLQRRCNQMGLDIIVSRIGILPHQIPKERRDVSLITYSQKDPRCNNFRRKFFDDPMVMRGYGYEIQALTPPEIRRLIVNFVEDTIETYGFEKREE